MRVLLLGSSGFLATHLARELAARGREVEGWSRSPAREPSFARVRAVDLLEPRAYADQRGPWAAAVLLAGLSVPSASWDAARVRENVLVSGRALDHLARAQPGLPVLVLSSLHVYARSSAPLCEEDRLSPASAYGRSKLHVEAWARARAGDLAITIVRSFHQIGPGMAPGLLVPDTVRALAASADGPLVMRGADSERDFLDVRDGARALAALLEVAPARAGEPRIVNLGSGRGTRVSAIARGLARRLAPRRTVVFQPGDDDPVVASVARLRGLTGQEPRHDLEATLDWIAGAAREG